MDHTVTRSAVIYNESETDLSYLITAIDSFCAAAEIIHGIKFKRKVQIIIAPRDSDFYNLFDTSYAMASFFPCGRIIIPPSSYRQLAEDKDRIERFILHELSHSLMFQNMSPLRAAVYPQWFFEGIAVYTSGQAGRDGLPSAGKIGQIDNAKTEEIFRKSRHLTLVSGMKEKDPEKLRLNYAVWSARIDCLITAHGKKKFYSFVRESTLRGPFNTVYEKFFGEKVFE